MGQTTGDTVVRGRMAPGGEARATSVHARGRVCSAEDCDTVLSMYNSTGSCWQHEEPHTYVLHAPRKKRRDAAVA